MKKKMVIAWILLAAMCQTGCGSLGDMREEADRWPEEEEYVDDEDEEDDDEEGEEPDTGEFEGEAAPAEEKPAEGLFAGGDSYTPEASPVAWEQTIYVDGRKTPMPKTVGDVEKLSGDKYVRSSKASNNSIYVTDSKNVILNEFFIKYCELPEDEEEQMEKVRDVELSRLIFSYSKKMKEHFSMLPDRMMFEGDYQEVTRELLEEYGEYIDPDDEYADGEYEEIEESGNIKFNCFERGYMMSWSWSADSAKLEIDYIPDSYVAFYRYLTGTLPEDRQEGGLMPFGEFRGVDEDTFGMYLGDITGDGAREVILDNSYSRMGVAYDPARGCLQKLFEVPHNSTVSYEPSGEWLLLKQYRDQDGNPALDSSQVRYVVIEAYLPDLEGNFTLLAHLEEPSARYAGGDDYSVNGISVSEEEYRVLWTTYGGYQIGPEETTLEEALEDVKILAMGEREKLWNHSPEKDVPEPYGEYPVELTLYGKEYEYIFPEGEPYDEIEEGYDETDE